MTQLKPLPAELLDFLAAGQQLDFDVKNSIVRQIRLKTASQLCPGTIRLRPGCQSIVDVRDPYDDLQGEYEVDVVDLVAESSHYDPEGLLCWIGAMECFGCIDEEHGTVMSFPEARWSDIVADPVKFLDAQWEDLDEVHGLAWPWLHFNFALDGTKTILEPYPPLCPVHNRPVTPQTLRKPALLEILRDRGWLQPYMTVFPCSGVPVSKKELLCCTDCRAAEDQWLGEIDNSIPILDARPNVQRWIKCPGCGKRFTLASDWAFEASQSGFGRHRQCGQKIRIVE